MADTEHPARNVRRPTAGARDAPAFAAERWTRDVSHDLCFLRGFSYTPGRGPMRFMLYNIRYGAGGRGLVPGIGYLCRTSANLGRIAEFLAPYDPDILGLVEVDAGSYRSHRHNQAETLAQALGHYHTYKSKYADASLASVLPLMNKQGNAFLTRDSIRSADFHYFTKGMKRLVIELELENLTIFLVHLALNFRTRHHQLSDLYDLVNGTCKPHIVAGDFNAFWGDREINLFLAATKLTNANTASTPTFPSWSPRRQLDYVLYSEGICPRQLDVVPVTLSDHLPVVFDFDVQCSAPTPAQGAASSAAASSISTSMPHSPRSQSSHSDDTACAVGSASTSSSTVP
jgi:endonuclease/exonuclease/phosphatase family metal-dependent hydrolase